MPAAVHNFIIEQGSNFFITFQYLDINSNPVDITKYCIRLAIKTNTGKIGLYSSNAPDKSYILRSVPNALGTIEWGLSYNETRVFNFDNAVYDLQLVDANNEEIRICTGTITIAKNSFPECINDTIEGCQSCSSIVAAQSFGQQPSAEVDNETQSADGTAPSPTPTPVIPSNLQQEELCDYLCKGIDLFGKLYNYQDNIVYISGSNSGVFLADPGQLTFGPINYVTGLLDMYLNDTKLVPSQFNATNGTSVNLINLSINEDDEIKWINKGLVIKDLSVVTGTMHIASTGTVTNVEVTISNLKYTNPQDLSMILVPPIGDAVLLSSFNKINNYSAISGLNYTFSNKAVPDRYLNNRSVNDLYINILDKTTDYYNSTSYTLTGSLTHLNNISPSGDWSLVITDHDLGGSGTIDGWNLIITYEPPLFSEENI